MNSVSFQGNITVTTWNKAVSSIKQYPTTQAQDKLMKDVAKDIGKQGEMLPLSKKNANFLYQLIEKITGRSIFNSQTEAAEWVIQNGYSKASKTTVQGHIGEVCSGKWKSAYGFKWE